MGSIPDIPISSSRRVFTDHEDIVNGVAVFPDGRRMVTSSGGNALCLWNFKDGVVLKKMEGHDARVRAVTVSLAGDAGQINSKQRYGRKTYRLGRRHWEISH